METPEAFAERVLALMDLAISAGGTVAKEGIELLAAAIAEDRLTQNAASKVIYDAITDELLEVQRAEFRAAIERVRGDEYAWVAWQVCCDVVLREAKLT